MNKKVLLFEGAGMSYKANERSNIGNHRIRTAFINNDGNTIYLELGGSEFTEKKTKRLYWQSRIDHVFYITGSGQECNENRISIDWQYIRDNVQYTKESMIEYINKLCNTDFETLEVLDDMEGYRVHADNRGYNLMDNHVLNRERTLARIKAYNEIDTYYRDKLGEKYSKISLLEKTDNSITVRCYASKESMARAGLSEQDREKTILVEY